jgi:hypothetical protein
MTRRTLLTAALGMTAAAACPNADPQTADAAPLLTPLRVQMRRRVIQADSDFEVACAADVNGDGKLEIVCGDTWYEAPDWKPHKFREIPHWGKGPDSSGYRDDFADLPMDVNGDGKIDLVSAEWRTGEVSWWENPGDSRTPWKEHVIAQPGNSETAIFAPILGKKRPCLLPNVAQQVVWYELRTVGPKPHWVEHVVGKEGAGHGIGFGDVNRDGKIDIVTPRGWYEQVDARADKWIWHPEWNCNPGDCGIGMLVYDVDGDGRNDIVWGSGHNYGLYWLQQQPAGSAQKWVQHTIDKSWSQAHALTFADLEGRRRPVLLTGKRYLAHDHDPGAHDPLCLYTYYYDRKAKRWRKSVVDEGERAGAGLQLTVADLRGTGRLDVIAPGKSGLYLFENEGIIR